VFKFRYLGQAEQQLIIKSGNSFWLRFSSLLAKCSLHQDCFFSVNFFDICVFRKYGLKVFSGFWMLKMFCEIAFAFCEVGFASFQVWFANRLSLVLKKC